MSACKSCGADIRWEISDHGKRLPLDVEPVADGNLVIVAGVVAPYIPELNATMSSGAPRPRYVSHFATCPQADDWRKKRPPKGESGV